LVVLIEEGIRVFENTVLRKIFEPKRGEATGDWRKLYYEVLNDLPSSPNILRVIKSRMGWAGHVARMRKSTSMYRVLVGKTEGKRLWKIGRLRRRWEDDIQMEFKAVGCGHGLD
jgi:hypothetical protein